MSIIRPLVAQGFVLFSLLVGFAPVHALDLKNAVIVTSPNLSGPESKAVMMLIQEVEKRTQVRWSALTAWPSSNARWHKQYLPMVEGGTWAWLEIAGSDFFAQPLPKDVVASAFANREFHLVLANYGRAPVEIATTTAYVPVTEPLAAASNLWKLEARALRILRRVA